MASNISVQHNGGFLLDTVVDPMVLPSDFVFAACDPT